ncbi:site-specific integrase [uncultured Hydrogenophaga sp.]|uniref:site-specific integrase n=1 Tax=uncultured Hydrogenophaga sp. TaxID=199683 RepID=UPI002586296A|nr:site-specific integrase [uncultured Hydrogenophaga sp.]
MRPQAHHIFKSRHGIWYFRWVVPEELRERFPALPREVKRSLKTADTREARADARRLHSALVLSLSDGTFMSSGFELPRIRPWTIKLDPATKQVIEVSTDPRGETPQSYTAMGETLHALINRTVAEKAASAAASRQASPTNPAGFGEQSSMLLSEVVANYGRLQVQSGAWSTNTFAYTHEPSLRLFRELVGRPMGIASLGNEQPAALDIPLAELSIQKLESFLNEFWNFPDQQGKRHTGKTARDIMNAGGPHQSRANMYKRLAHIRQFIAHCCEKRLLPAELLKEIDVVLAKDTARAREKAALANAGADGTITDGYVAFSAADLKALFGSVFTRHTKGNVARRWIPLMGLYTGLRVGEVSQLRPCDFVEVDGLDCVRVTGDFVGGAPDPSKQTVKSPAALRTIPIHPRLRELGLLALVEERRRQRKDWMWDGLLWTEKSGYGKYPSRDFQKLARDAGVYVQSRKVFHSFRSTIAQELERCGLEGELIDRFLGHKVKNTRNQNYSRTESGRAFPTKRVYEALKMVEFPI